MKLVGDFGLARGNDQVGFVRGRRRHSVRRSESALKMSGFGLAGAFCCFLFVAGLVVGTEEEE